jgi:hypothetical protein
VGVSRRRGLAGLRSGVLIPARVNNIVGALGAVVHLTSTPELTELEHEYVRRHDGALSMTTFVRTGHVFSIVDECSCPIPQEPGLAQTGFG